MNFKRGKEYWLPGMLGVLAVAGLAGASAVSGTPAATDGQIQQSLTQANSLSSAFRAAADRVTQAVVTIRTMPADVERVSGSDMRQFDNGLPEELKDHPFFKRFFDGAPEGRQRLPDRPRRGGGQGSGVIIDSAGIILTNNHVVKGGGTVVVILQDGREFEATEVKTDPSTDIAVVRIDAGETLAAATIGNSDQMDVGDWVIAVGAPFGLKETVTAGIISAKSRGIGITDREEFLQTDAAINPGNSGGPLVNLNGEVVGINTAISSTSGGYQGIGFAVPINMAQWVGDQLVDTGSVRRAFLGVGIQQVTSDLSQQFGLGNVAGAAVTEIRSDSPAAEAGVRTGDVIVEFDGRKIDSPRTLQGTVERAVFGKDHKLVVMRKGRRVELTVRVSELPQNLTESDNGGIRRSELKDVGLEVTDLTDDVASKLDITGVNGVIVTSVKRGSAADKAGLAPKMVITRVGDMDVTSAAEFAKTMKEQLDDDGVLLLVRSGSASRFIVLKR
ncbi:MAG: Do family serine endopeptidase [Fuerstiella sp.]|nr:Do family serine endopeptidase [Fuerstiella sp.]MCP4857013.1 Do family serine endopeptidase [Fuerstiella sp.]